MGGQICVDGEFIKWPTTNQKYMCCFFRSVSLAQMMERGAGGGGGERAESLFVPDT